MSHDLTLIVLAITLILWGLTHFDLGRANKIIFIATGVAAVIGGLLLIFSPSILA